MDLRRLRPRAFFLRRASGAYSRLGGGDIASNKKYECAVDMSIYFMCAALAWPAKYPPPSHPLTYVHIR